MIFFIFLGCFSLSSCHLQFKNKDKDFKESLFKAIFSLSKIENLNEQYVNTGRSIDRPYKTTIDIIHFSKNLKLSYKIPARGKSGGILQIFDKEKMISSLEEISDLKIFLKINLKKRDHNEIKLYNFYIYYSKNKKKYKIIIPLYNLNLLRVWKSKKNNMKFEEYALFDTSAKNGLIRGMTINNGKFKRKKMGSKNDNYRESQIIFCHKVNKVCDDIKVNICNDCTYSFYEVVDFNCPQGGSKICGANECGAKGMPACPRHFVSRKKRYSNISCYDGSRAGICSPGLLTVCDGRGILICL